MATVTSFIRNTPKTSLQAYFDQAGIHLAPPVNWDAPGDIVRPLLQAVDEMDPVARDRLETVAERVTGMADEAGEAAIYSIAQNPALLDALRNAYDRALWMYLNDDAGFRHAEEVRFTDERRRGRMWDGFIGEANLVLKRDTASVDTFKTGIRDRFQSNNVHVDLFDRNRPSFEGADCAIVQATVYREGRPDDFLEFVDGMLDRRPRRPVFEAAITYEPATGVIEVVANDRDSREDLVRLFARDLLDVEFRQERLPFRQFDLGVLRQDFSFPTDPDDGIESVRVNLLRLMPIDAAGERVTLECMRQAAQTIWQMARDRFGPNNPLASGWVVTQAKLTIRFHPESGSRRGKTLPLTITMPHGCDLKDRTERERLIGEKYLRRWDILRDA
ncbi:MAG: hypothetical protein U1E67_06720 [Hyphomicrobiales bacterium]